MSDYSTARTQFVRDRLAETTFQNRRYIGHLMWLERIISRGGPTQWAEGMAYHSLTRDYPLETAAIKQELQDGKLTTTEEFKTQQATYRVKVQRDAEGYRLCKERQDREELKEWLRAGGLRDAQD